MDAERRNEIERLWAPWRLGYVQGNEAGDPAEAVSVDRWRSGADRDCFLCRAAAAATEHDRELGVVDRTDRSVVVPPTGQLHGGSVPVADFGVFGWCTFAAHTSAAHARPRRSTCCRLRGLDRLPPGLAKCQNPCECECEVMMRAQLDFVNFNEAAPTCHLLTDDITYLTPLRLGEIPRFPDSHYISRFTMSMCTVDSR